MTRTETWANETFDFEADTAPEKIGAFFDIDETLVRGATAYWAAKELFRRSVLGVAEVGMASRHALSYFLFGERSKDKVAGVMDHALRLTEGIELEALQPLAEDVYEQYFVPKVYRATYERLREHVESGHAVYLVSATPWLIAEGLARALGAAGGIGTRTKVLDGRLAGELEGGVIHGEGKVVEVCRVVEELGLDLERSWAYSDSMNDVPLLSLVGNPVAVNPDRHLAAYARREGWPIVKAYETWDLVKRTAGQMGLAFVAGAAAYMVWKGAWRGGSAIGRVREARKTRSADAGGA